ncbi:MAG TPA: hypothetical protein VHZ04_01725 [Candidatus Paceibacterota bacterium]|jgi:hypothetical protein|nr:hypothetical protein [Candidatus Paceibacterota bacterium]
MADDVRPDKRPWIMRVLDRVFQEAVVSGIIVGLFKKWGNYATAQTKTYVEDPECGRAELVIDIQKLTTNGKKPLNILRRHKQAIAEKKENRFVALLTKLPKDETTKDRTNSLMFLDGLDDEEFNQVLYWLDHDVFLQTYDRWRERYGRTFGEFWKDFKTTIHRYSVAAKNDVHQASDGVNKSLRQSAAWFRKREEERRVHTAQPIPRIIDIPSGGTQ